MKESYGTLSETINGLKEEGYTLDFNVLQENLTRPETTIHLSPDDFRIDKTYRFEGESNPDDQAILYAISAKKYCTKGILINGYGVSAEEATDLLIAKLEIHADRIGPGGIESPGTM